MKITHKISWEAIDMIQVLVGGIGTGKTKTLVNMANKELSNCQGQIVFVSGEKRMMIELKHQIRLINLRDFEVRDFKTFYGFLNGIIAQNYDVERIYIDGLFEFIKDDGDKLDEFFDDIKSISEKFNTKIIISMNGDPQSVPAFLKEYIA